MKLLQLESLVFCDQENDKNSDDDENDEHDAAGTTPVDAGSDVEVNFTTTNLMVPQLNDIRDLHNKINYGDNLHVSVIS
jgi:hypothetical protein